MLNVASGVNDFHRARSYIISIDKALVELVDGGNKLTG